MNGRRWSREEAIVVLGLYCRIPFAKSRKTHPAVERVAQLIDRSPDSVHLRIGNFGSCDPYLREQGIVGLGHTGRLVREIWDEFQGKWAKLVHAAFRLERDFERARPPLAPAADLVALRPEALRPESSRMVRVRNLQGTFRDMVVAAAYGGKCCVTSIDNPQLLIASHIKPWAKSSNAEKLDPKNGLCLNALHDRAFDRGLITIDRKHRVRVSSELLRRSSSPVLQQWAKDYKGKKIALPEKLVDAPAPDFLEWHADNIFLG